MSLVAALPVAAQAKKKKGPKPYKSEEVIVQAGHPAFNGTSGTHASITGQEFLNSCAIPNSNGVDAYVFATPEGYGSIASTIKLFATNSWAVPVEPDPDIYLYDESCTPTLSYLGTTPGEEVGTLPEGTAFILVHNYTGGPTAFHFELTPYVPTPF